MNLMQCSLLLGSNYADDPLYHYAFQGTGIQRHRGIEAYFTALLEYCLAAGNIILAPGNAGLAAWVPYTAFPPEIDETSMASHPAYVRTGWERLKRHLLAAQDIVSENGENFGFCALLTVDFSTRGRGFARSLLDACAEQMLEAGLTECWLATENAMNIPFLEHMGFQKLTTLHQPTGPQSWIFRKPLVKS